MSACRTSPAGGWARPRHWQRRLSAGRRSCPNQVRYSLLERGIEREVVAARRRLSGSGCWRYSPLGGGVLTGKYRGGVPTDSRAAAGYRNLADFRRAEEAGIVEAVATAAEGLATAPIAVALSWVRDQPGVSSVILGARTLGQLDRGADV